MAKVLIIDDERMMCDSLSKIVQRMGHEVTCAYTVKEGMEQTSTGAYDVVFLDVNLPDGNGLEMLPQPPTSEVICAAACEASSFASCLRTSSVISSEPIQTRRT